MRHEIAFVGDIHGQLSALVGLLDVLKDLDVGHKVFLGDYINKGPDSAAVVTELLKHARSGDTTLLSGNHEAALIDAVDTGSITALLKMSGAPTIRSYVGRNVRPHVFEDFRLHVPSEHIEAIRTMPTTFAADGVLAQHAPLVAERSEFQVSAHVMVGRRPLIKANSAEIDTGCGSSSEGLLTALLWPSLDFVQVDMIGSVV